jgi:very-short-patch-repair endonuclease
MRLYKYECTICGRLWNKETDRLINKQTCAPKCASIKGYLSGERKETGIELKLQEMLTAMGIEFVTQKPILGVTIADVFIYPNVAVFADGTYWHSGAMKEHKDKEKTDKLKKGGYVVLRLEEEEINKDEQSVQEKLRYAYGQRRAAKKL